MTRKHLACLSLKRSVKRVSGGKMNKASLSCIIHIPKINLLVYSKLYLISHLKYLLFLSFNTLIKKKTRAISPSFFSLDFFIQNFLWKTSAVNDLRV